MRENLSRYKLNSKSTLMLAFAVCIISSQSETHGNPGKLLKVISGFRSSSVTQSCPTLCDPMNRSTPVLPVHHHLPAFTQTHVHWVSEAIQPSHPLLPLLISPSIFPSAWVFSNELAFGIRRPKYWRRFQHHQFFGASHIHTHDHWKNHSFD